MRSQGHVLAAPTRLLLTSGNAGWLAVWAPARTAAQRSQTALLGDFGLVLSTLGPSLKAVGWLSCGSTAAVATGSSYDFHKPSVQAARWRASGLLPAVGAVTNLPRQQGEQDA